ncbi:L-ascorbate oxidase [Gaeumannomyces tritici R3-111a-1]|uniref:L-ascorbate oxidase n=1 Tax=Gaeumannomyces tritici (strain R3-111a-1) TaxID=644352 RepID=J3PEY6_GAET3|nr:L-ascorbate oxidase [Gaeumannomyces tritici R3-111a-1]EJT71044.1 L-ascorbate oxidase [Gaeumannomyces tritici R3-111a-1]
MKSFRILRLPLLALLHLARTEQAGGVVHDSTWTPDYVLEATAQTITLDCRQRHSVVVNSSSPGPTLYLTENKTTWVRVHNRMPDQNFTVHWHGLTQRVAPFSDGTPLVSQWPIAPGAFFDYELRPDAVTAHGALIVREQGSPPYEYDEELIVGLGDFFQKNDSTVVQGLLADPFQWSGEPDALLFQRLERDSGIRQQDGRRLLPAQRGDGQAGQDVPVTLGIEGHQNLTVIEAEGHYTQPAMTDHVQLGSGQRFSVLLQTRTEDDIAARSGKTQFWIRFESRDRPKTIVGYALLQYDMSDSQAVSYQTPLPQELPATSPVVLPTETSSWLEYTLQPLDSEEAARFPRLPEVTRTVYITMAQQLNSLAWQESALADDTGYVPLLVRLYVTGETPDYGAARANQDWDPETKAFPALVGETLDIVWLSNSGPTGGWDAHPMHMHGERYWDLGLGNGTYDAAANEAARFGGGYTPARRDTTMLYRYAAKGGVHMTAGWRAWRVRVTEESVGAWVLHYHVLMHMVMGMQTVWVFGNTSQILTRFPQQPYIAGYLDFGGSVYGNGTSDPVVWETFSQDGR